MHPNQGPFPTRGFADCYQQWQKHSLLAGAGYSGEILTSKTDSFDKELVFNDDGSFPIIKIGMSCADLVDGKDYVDIIKQANALITNDKEDIDQIGYNFMTPIYTAATVGNLDMACYLCERDCDTNIADAQGNTPFHMAILKGDHPSIVRLLLDKNPALLERRNSDGDTPLMMALMKTPYPKNRPMV